MPTEENGQKIKLQSSDGKVFEVDVDVANVSLTIKGMLEALGVHEDDVVPLPNVSSEVLEKVIVWATYHKNDSLIVEEEEPPAGTWKPMKPKTYDTYVAPWDQEFLKVDQDMLFELIAASLYLNITGLKDAACKTVAKMMTGKTPKQLRKMFKIKNGFPRLGEKSPVKKMPGTWPEAFDHHECALPVFAAYSSCSLRTVDSIVLKLLAQPRGCHGSEKIRGNF